MFVTFSVKSFSC